MKKNKKKGFSILFVLSICFFCGYIIYNPSANDTSDLILIKNEQINIDIDTSITNVDSIITKYIRSKRSKEAR